MFLAYFWKINNSYKTPKNKPSVEITDRSFVKFLTKANMYIIYILKHSYI